MGQKPPSKPAAPAEVLSALSLGYNTYTDPTQTNPKMWAAATNVYSGAFSFIQRCRFANVVVPSPLTTTFFTTLKYFALPPFTISTTIGTITYTGGLVPFATVVVSSTSGIGPAGNVTIVDNSNVLFNSTFPIGTIVNTTTLTIVFSQVAAASGSGGTLSGLNSGGAYLIADINGKLYSYDTGLNYLQTQRLNPYVDPSGVGNTQLNGPWSREALVNILYEMNGQVKMAGRLANAATIEGWGLDSPDATPQITLNAGTAVALTNIRRQNAVVTAHAAALPAGVIVGSTNPLNITLVSDPSFNGTFLITASGVGPFTFTWSQLGQDTVLLAGTGNITSQVTKSVGRSYAYAWENANKSHVGALSPVTQYIIPINQYMQIACLEPGTISFSNASPIVTGVATFFTAAWIGRHILSGVTDGDIGRVLSVQSPTQLTLAANSPTTDAAQVFQVFDPQATHIRLYATADGGATYFLIARNVFSPFLGSYGTNFAGLIFLDFANSEPPSFPFSTETAQLNNIPPPVGAFVNEFQGRLCVFGVPGEPQAFFYSNVEATLIGQPQESFAPLNQVTLPIQNASMNGMMELPGSMIIWSDKQDMFRLTGLLTDNLVGATGTQQGAQISRLPYALGCATPFAVAVTSLGGFWLTPNDEVWLFTDRYAPRNIGRPIQDILLSMAPGAETLARMVYYHTANRNWLLLIVAANGSTYNNTVLVLDLDLLASNGEASYYVFDMATNSPAWWVFQPGTADPETGDWIPRCDSIEVVYETSGLVRLMCGQVDLIQDIDFLMGGFGTEIEVPNGTVTLHAFGNESPFLIKRPTFVRFNTNRDPAMLATDGWSFAVQGIDDDFYTFFNPLVLDLVPGVNDTSALSGSPDFTGGLAFRHSPELFRIGGVNFVMGRRLKFQINFPPAAGSNFAFRAIQLAFGANPPS
jgi:hypothetical protein